MRDIARAPSFLVNPIRYPTPLRPALPHPTLLLPTLPHPTALPGAGEGDEDFNDAVGSSLEDKGKDKADKEICGGMLHAFSGFTKNTQTDLIDTLKTVLICRYPCVFTPSNQYIYAIC